MVPTESNDMTRCARCGLAGQLRTLRRCIFSASIALLLAACATTTPPLADLDAADAALRDARALNADDLAPVELGFATSKRAEAAAAMDSRDYSRARLLASQAAVDAALAAAKSRAATARLEVQRKTSENAKLRSELLGQGAQQ